jgi:hypothetical protein
MPENETEAEQPLSTGKEVNDLVACVCLADHHEAIMSTSTCSGEMTRTHSPDDKASHVILILSTLPW